MATSPEELITCKICGYTDSITKKLKCSACGAKDWGHQLTSKSKKGCLWEIIFVTLFFGGYIIYDNVKKYRNNHWSQAEIENSFSKNVVLVYHEFAFELEFDDPNEEPLYFIQTANGGFTQWQKGMPPNSVTGCGFMVKPDGACITTRNLTHPWLSDWDMLKLKREVQIFRNPPFNIRSGGHYSLFTVKLGYYISGTAITNPASFISCKSSGSWEKGIEEMQVKNPSVLPAGIRQFDYHTGLFDLKKDDAVFFIGYPIQISKSENLNTMIIQNKIDSVKSDDFYFPVTSIFTLEGAPAFNEQGTVVGLATVDEKGKLKAIRTDFERVKK
ncbi:MAG: hypothetical protein ABI685_08705 [Ferruginibacter sp.]